jgi:hypothetical protein
MARSHPEIASSYFGSEIPEGISLKEMPNFDRMQVEHMKLNTIDENCKYLSNPFIYSPSIY